MNFKLSRLSVVLLLAFFPLQQISAALMPMAQASAALVSVGQLPAAYRPASSLQAVEDSPFAWTVTTVEKAAGDSDLLARNGEVSQGEAVRIAQQRFGGKAVKVERSGGVYLVRLLLPNGRVKMVVVDASSGASRE